MVTWTRRIILDLIIEILMDWVFCRGNSAPILFRNLQKSSLMFYM
jgi:hypothetical protein